MARTNTTVNGSEYFRITRTIGHKIVDGKKVPVKKQFYGTSKRNAELKYEEWKKQTASKSIDPSRLTSDLAEEFNESFRLDSRFATSTINLYIASYKANFKATGLGNIPIGQLSYQHIQKAYNEFPKSAGAMKTFSSWMRLFMNYCERAGYCDDVLRLVIIPQKERNQRSEEIVVWTDSEINMIEEKMKDHRYYPCIMLSLYAGLRMGEVLGLKWSDIHDGLIHINRQYEKGVICKPKHGSSRIVPMHDKIKDALEDYPRTKDYIFLTSTGNFIDDGNFKTALQRAYKSKGIPYKSFHTYRRTFCTKLCESGAPIQTASKLMGHKNISTTSKHYARIEQSTMFDAINKL